MWLTLASLLSKAASCVSRRGGVEDDNNGGAAAARLTDVEVMLQQVRLEQQIEAGRLRDDIHRNTDRHAAITEQLHDVKLQLGMLHTRVAAAAASAVGAPPTAAAAAPVDRWPMMWAAAAVVLLMMVVGASRPPQLFLPPQRSDATLRTRPRTPSE